MNGLSFDIRGGNRGQLLSVGVDWERDFQFILGILNVCFCLIWPPSEYRFWGLDRHEDGDWVLGLGLLALQKVTLTDDSTQDNKEVK